MKENSKEIPWKKKNAQTHRIQEKQFQQVKFLAFVTSNLASVEKWIAVF